MPAKLSEVRSEKSEVRSLNNKLTSFPSDDFLSHAVQGLQRLAFEHRVKLDHRELQRRHAPAGPQAPHAA